ncbi:MAG: phosphotriesterase-related protein [Actinomycetota bacterium]|jgi:phosphotriesterase-related protein|nr:phosphotriesterase-related protein [Actinomycetota bacterium]
MHEHVFTLTVDSQQQWSDEWDEETKVAEAVETLTALRATGVQTIVDPTVDGLGRNVPRVLRINEQVPTLNILVATGIYTYADVPGFFAARGPGGLPGLPEVMTPLFVRDITEGIQGTTVKAAFLKCAIDHHGLTEGVERVMRSCAQAAVETGRPLMVHTHPRNRTGLEVQRVLGEEGLALSRVVLAHSGDSTDADHLSELADTGFLLGMDRFGIDTILGFDERVGIVVEMCRRGYAESMVLSQDAACYIDWVAPDLMPFLPNWNYQHVLSDVVPALLERGVSQDQVDAMLVANPRRFFES